MGKVTIAPLELSESQADTLISKLESGQVVDPITVIKEIPFLVEKPVEVEKIIYVDRPVVKEKIIEVPGPERIIEKPIHIIEYKTVEVPGPERVYYVEIPGPEKIIYKDKPSTIIDIEPLLEQKRLVNVLEKENRRLKIAALCLAVIAIFVGML